MLTLDQMPLDFQATTRRVWAPIGQTPVIRVTPQRDHVHLYGALNGRTGQDIVLTLPDHSTQTTVHFLAHGLACFPTQPIRLLLDQAPWHHGPALTDFLAQHPRRELRYFPPACPDLNPQEHGWEHARDAIRHTHTFTGFARLRAAFTAFLDNTLFPLDWLEHYAPATLYVVYFGFP